MLIPNIFIINPIKIDKISGFKIKLFKNSNNFIFFFAVSSRKKLTIDIITTLSIKIIFDICVIVLRPKKISDTGKTRITWFDKPTVSDHITDSCADLLKTLFVSKKAKKPLIQKAGKGLFERPSPK